MILDLTSIALWTLFGWSLGMLTAMAIGRWLQSRDKRCRRQQAMDNACNELERGKA